MGIFMGYVSFREGIYLKKGWDLLHAWCHVMIRVFSADSFGFIFWPMAVWFPVGAELLKSDKQGDS